MKINVYIILHRMKCCKYLDMMRLLEAVVVVVVVVLLQCSQEVEAVVLLAGGGADPPLALPIHVVTRLGHQGAAHKRGGLELDISN